MKHENVYLDKKTQTLVDCVKIAVLLKICFVLYDFKNKNVFKTKLRTFLLFIYVV